MNPPKTTFIYGLWDPRNYQLRYIGKSDNPEKRLEGHILEAKAGQNTRKSNWIKQLLRLNLEPSLEILEECNEDEWSEVEKIWISECKKFGLGLTNIAIGGNSPPSRRGIPTSDKQKEMARQHAKNRIRTEEERRKLSESKKGKPTWVKGKHLTEEHKKKIGLANSGKKPSQESIAKRLEKMKGYVISDEGRKKLSDGLKLAYLEGRRVTPKGRKHSEETKRKISESNKGKHNISEEVKQKIGNSNRGKKRSQEIVEAMRERAKKAWERKRTELSDQNS